MDVDVGQCLCRQEIQQVRESEEPHTVLSQVALRTIVHIVLEAQLLQCLIGVDNLLWLMEVATLQNFLLGRRLLRLLRLFLSQLLEYLLNALCEALLYCLRVSLDDTTDLLSSFFLSVHEDIKLKDSIVGFQCVLFHVDDPQLVHHLDAAGSVLLQDVLEYSVCLEKLLFKCLLDVISFVLEDIAAPHPDYLPLPEIPEEVLVCQLLVVASILDPFM